MVKLNTAFSLLAGICLFIYACKLDKVPPTPPANIKEDDTVLGMTIIGPELYNPYLTSKWTVSYTILEFYDTTTVVVGGAINPNFFSGMVINDQAKKFNFINLKHNINATGEYKLNTINNVFYLKLPVDPFSRTANYPIRITKLNSQTMTWVAVDSLPTTYNHKLVYKAYKVFFHK